MILMRLSNYPDCSQWSVVGLVYEDFFFGVGGGVGLKVEEGKRRKF